MMITSCRKRIMLVGIEFVIYIVSNSLAKLEKFFFDEKW